jgi:hypothetical protein
MGFKFGDARRKVPAPTMTVHDEVSSGEIRPEVSTYSLVSRVYKWFGFTRDQIPFVVGETIDISQIVNMRRV